MDRFDNPALRALRANVSGKVESGEAEPIVEIRAADGSCPNGHRDPIYIDDDTSECHICGVRYPA